MNLFDLAALLLLVGAVLAGIRTGALPQVGGIAGAVTGLLLALNAGPWLVDITADLEPIPRAIAVLGAILVAVLVGETIGSSIGAALAGGLGHGVLSGLERAVGGALGAAQAVLLVWLVGGLLVAGPFPTLGREASHSTTVRTLSAVLPPPTDVVDEVAAALDDSGLPDVFVGLDPIPLPGVDIPTDTQAGAIAAAAVTGTARISTRACDTQVTGTGVLVANGYLVTNAHVVAGASTIRAAIGPEVVDATPVLFDPDLDIAVLHVPGLAGRPLRFATSDPERGDRGAVLGFAGGGPLVVLAAAVSGDYAATGRDIYGEHQVTRDILELRAAVDPGDSGGPLVLTDGSIGGIVFAESRTDPGIGYALSPTAVSVRVAPALGRSGAVDVGDCLR